jgi:hypothetical protein
MSILERRFEGRFLCADLVSVSWGDFQKVGAVLEDISPLGACVQLEESIPLDTPITLSIGAARLSGHVCYSVFRDYGQFVGIRFADDMEWSAEIVVPQHLTNLETIGHAVMHADTL